MSVVLTVWSAFIFFRAFIPFHCAVFFRLLKHLLFLEIDLKPGLACPLFLWTRSCHGYLIICTHLTGLWSDERRWSVPFSIDAAGIMCVTKQKAVHFGFKTLFARKSALNCALQCFDCINDSITAPYSCSACVCISSSSVLWVQNRYNYSTSFLFKFPAGIFSAWNQCLPVCLWNFLRK